jgi:hypothetical protein
MIHAEERSRDATGDDPLGEPSTCNLATPAGPSSTGSFGRKADLIITTVSSAALIAGGAKEAWRQRASSGRGRSCRAAVAFAVLTPGRRGADTSSGGAAAPAGGRPHAPETGSGRQPFRHRARRRRQAIMRQAASPVRLTRSRPSGVTPRSAGRGSAGATRRRLESRGSAAASSDRRGRRHRVDLLALDSFLGFLRTGGLLDCRRVSPPAPPRTPVGRASHAHGDSPEFLGKKPRRSRAAWSHASPCRRRRRRAASPWGQVVQGARRERAAPAMARRSAS